MDTGKAIMDKVRSIKGTDSDKDILVEKNRATVAGAATGTLIGVYYGFSRKQNIVVCALMGALAGALVVRLFMPKTTD
jgi:uncharacterized membrane protein